MALNQGYFLRDDGTWASSAQTPVNSYGDTNATLANTDRIVEQNTAFTANRTWTLPASSNVPQGTRILMIFWGASSTASITVATQGSDVIYQPLDFGNVPTITSGQPVSWEFVLLGNSWVLISPFIISMDYQVGGSSVIGFLNSAGSWRLTNTAMIWSALNTESAGLYSGTTGGITIDLNVAACFRGANQHTGAVTYNFANFKAGMSGFIGAPTNGLGIATNANIPGYGLAGTGGQFWTIWGYYCFASTIFFNRVF